VKHLDIGCGDNPKNPYEANEVFGVDVHPEVEKLGPNFHRTNLITDSLPFADSTFDSVSAFDVLEHIPRLVVDYAERKHRNSFIELMDEVHRVLKPGGKFYAMTPAYPSHEAFVDPTHVNFISNRTHEYFCGPTPYASRYGFKGQFKCLESRWLNNSVGALARRNLALECKIFFRTYIKRNQTHFVWQLQAIK
jgi:SAM-dependent methyltransferase